MAASKVVRYILSALAPIGVAVNMIKKVAAGNNHAIGSAAGEMELLDSSTGKSLIATVDGRSGTKYTGKFDKCGSL